MEEPGFDASDEVWRCAAPCFFELCYGECYKCGKIYARTSDMEEYDGELLRQDYLVNLDPAVPWSRPPSPWVTKEDWLETRRRKSPFESAADDEPFRQFLSERGVTEEMMDRFDVEWSPVDGLVACLDGETGAEFAAGFALVKADRTNAPGLEDLIMDSEQDGPRLWRRAIRTANFTSTGSSTNASTTLSTFTPAPGLTPILTSRTATFSKLKLADGTLIPLVQPVPYDELKGLGDFEEEEDQLPGETDPNVVVVVGSSSPLPAAGGAAAAEGDDDDDLMWVT